MFQRDPRAGAFLGGDRVSGQEIRDQNGAQSSCVNDVQGAHISSNLLLWVISPNHIESSKTTWDEFNW